MANAARSAAVRGDGGEAAPRVKGWYMPNVRGTAEFPHAAIDTNYWKTFCHAGLATPAGERGTITLYGKSARPHELFAEHVAGSETWTETYGHGRSAREWRLRVSKPDNHWLDCLVGCAVGASMLGAKGQGQEAAQAGRRRKRYTQEDLNRGRR